MQTTDLPFLQFLRNAPQLLLPIYQRRYRWTAQHCERLVADALRAGADPEIRSHYVGMITTVSPHHSSGPWHSPLTIVDGQQRIATTLMLLAILARRLPGENVALGLTPDQIGPYFLWNAHEAGERRHKLLLTPIDRQTLLGLLHPDERLPSDPSPRLVQNFRLLERRVAQLSAEELNTLCAGIAKLMVVHTALHPGIDDAQQIFETMNSTGQPLDDSDLIRNFLLMGHPEDVQHRIHVQYLRPLEQDFGRDDYEAHFPIHARAFLALRTGSRPRQTDLYASFQEYAASGAAGEAAPDSLAKDLRTLGHYYCVITHGTEPHPALRSAFARLQELKMEPALPLFFRLYEESAQSRLAKDDFALIVKTIEDYLLRRAVCGLHPGSHTHTFTRLARSSLLAPRHLEHIRIQLLLQSETARFPSDEEFQTALESVDLYSRLCAQHVLISLENHDREPPLNPDVLEDFSVEHVMPQQSPLPPHWRAHLGPDHQRIHDRWVHSLGNLTLTQFNSALGTKSFEDKLQGETGYDVSPLERLNDDMRNADAWTEDAIRQRGQSLARLALSIWPWPSVPDGVLEEARVRARRVWTLDDHPQLQPGAPMRDLYERICLALARINLHPEALRNYIAFKARTNVLDIIPKRRSLSCYLNCGIGDLVDPHGLAVEHPRSKHSGNGDVLVVIRTVEQIPGLVDLVRQVLDRQQAAPGPDDPDDPDETE